MPKLRLDSATWHNDASLGWKESVSAARSLDRAVVVQFAMLLVLITICPTVGWIYRHLHVTYSLSLSLSLITAIYNIVSQRQMSGRSDSDFSPASNVVPITVEPTQNSSNKGACCQSNWDFPADHLLLHLQANGGNSQIGKTGRWTGKMETGRESHTRTLGSDLSVWENLIQWRGGNGEEV